MTHTPGGGAPGPFTPEPPRQRKFRCRRAEVRGQQEVDTWPPPVRAEEPLRAEMAAQLNVEQLEVSLDGLTLSPDSEERPGAEGAPLLPPPPSSPEAGQRSGAAGQRRDPGEAAAEGAAEEARRMEQHWGFGLEELYGLALRFFKSERVTRLCGPRVPHPPALGRGDRSAPPSLVAPGVCHYRSGPLVTPPRDLEPGLSSSRNLKLLGR